VRGWGEGLGWGVGVGGWGGGLGGGVGARGWGRGQVLPCARAAVHTARWRGEAGLPPVACSSPGLSSARWRFAYVVSIVG
jgi:hypothetical protein